MEPSKRLIDSEIIGKEIIGDVLPLYGDLETNLTKMVEKFYDKYASSPLDPNEINKIMTVQERREFKEAVRPNLERLEFTVSDIYSKQDLSQMTRLQGLREQARWEIEVLSEKEEGIQREGYSRIAVNSYLLAGAFVAKELPAKKTSQIINKKIAGENWSSRIWGNNRKLRKQVLSKINEGISKGWSPDRMVSQIRQRVDVGKYNTTRVVRTESNRINGDATIERFKADGVKYYEFLADLDNDTSSICMELNGQVFRVDEAEEGVNRNPMHVNCRSNIKELTDEEAEKMGVKSREEAVEMREKAERESEKQRKERIANRDSRV